MPNRILRDGILTSDAVERIADQPQVEMFCRRLHSVADDYGRFPAKPSLLRAALYPLRLDKVTDHDVTEHLSACAAAGLILLYTADGKPYLEVLKFNQRTRAKKSKYPPPPPDLQMTAERGHLSDKRQSDDGHVRTETETYTETYAEARDGDGGRRRRETGVGHIGPKPGTCDEDWRHRETFTAAWQSHLKHRANQPLQVVAQTLIGRNGAVDWNRLESVHPAYCQYWSARGWDYCPLAFLEWIDAGMPEPPPKPTASAAERQTEINVKWEGLGQ